jgi:hypothetical protein
MIKNKNKKKLLTVVQHYLQVIEDQLYLKKLLEVDQLVDEHLDPNNNFYIIYEQNHLVKVVEVEF